MTTFIPIIIGCSSMALQAASENNFFGQSDAFLTSYVEDGLVSYAEIKDHPNGLEELIRQIADGVALQSKSRDDSLAFYIDAYNLIVIDAVVEHFPVKSPMDIPGFFDKNLHKVAGEQLTLNQLENQKDKRSL